MADANVFPCLWTQNGVYEMSDTWLFCVFCFLHVRGLFPTGEWMNQPADDWKFNWFMTFVKVHVDLNGPAYCQREPTTFHWPQIVTYVGMFIDTIRDKRLEILWKQLIQIFLWPQTLFHVKIHIKPLIWTINWWRFLRNASVRSFCFFV